MVLEDRLKLPEDLDLVSTSATDVVNRLLTLLPVKVSLSAMYSQLH